MIKEEQKRTSQLLLPNLMTGWRAGVPEARGLCKYVGHDVRIG
jgi:hypothetical protein